MSLRNYCLHLAPPCRPSRRHGRMTAVLCRAQMGPEDAEVGTLPSARAPAAAKLLPTRARRFAQTCPDPPVHAARLGIRAVHHPTPSDLGLQHWSFRTAQPATLQLLPASAPPCLHPPLPFAPPVGCRPASGTPLPRAAAGSPWAAPPAAAAAAATQRAVTAPQLAAGSGMRSPSCSAPTSTRPLW